MRNVLICLICVFVSCVNPQEEIENINRIYNTPVNEECKNKSKVYFYRFGYNISNYFEIIDIGAKDLDNNGVNDSIVILSPLELSYDYEFCNIKQNDTIENRILLINLMNSNGTILKKYKYDNVVSNELSYPIKSGSEYINFSEDTEGFVLFQDFGQGCYVQYNIYINYFFEKSSFIIDSIVFKSACPIDTMEKILNYDIKNKPYFLQDYNRSILDKPLKKIFKGN